MDVLASQSVEEAGMKLESLEIGAYNPFNLFVADRAERFAITYEQKPRPVRLDSDAIVIGNADPNAAPTPKLEQLERQVEAVSQGSAADVLDGLAGICSSHQGGGDPFRDACVHAGRYGTRSSTLLVLGDHAADHRLRHSDHAPCKTEYQDLTPLLHELGIDARLTGGETLARSIS
jgi:uncharacterized protein with NRDE domain